MLPSLARFFINVICVDQFLIKTLMLIHIMDVSTPCKVAHAITFTSVRKTIYASQTIWFSPLWALGAFYAVSAFQKQQYVNVLLRCDIQLRLVFPRWQKKRSTKDTWLFAQYSCSYVMSVQMRMHKFWKYLLSWTRTISTKNRSFCPLKYSKNSRALLTAHVSSVLITKHVIDLHGKRFFNNIDLMLHSKTFQTNSSNNWEHNTGVP